jgi:hypothetical protein
VAVGHSFYGLLVALKRMLSGVPGGLHTGAPGGARTARAGAATEDALWRG